MNDKIYTIYIDNKEHFIDHILNQVDEIRFKENEKHPKIELILENIVLNAKEFYNLFDELVIHQNVLISSIKTNKKADPKMQNYESEDIVFIGNINKDTTIICSQNVKVMGVVEGTIILNDENKSVYAQEFIQANVMLKNQMIHIEHEKNYTVKK